MILLPNLRIARIQSGGRKFRASAATASSVVKVANKLPVMPSPFGKRASMFERSACKWSLESCEYIYGLTAGVETAETWLQAAMKLGQACASYRSRRIAAQQMDMIKTTGLHQSSCEMARSKLAVLWKLQQAVVRGVRNALIYSALTLRLLPLCYGFTVVPGPCTCGTVKLIQPCTGVCS